MGLVYNASVADIKEDTPTKTDKFYVDTNVWYWMTYNLGYHPDDEPHYYVKHYSKYIKKALERNSSLFFSTISICELFKVTERAYHKHYNYIKEEEINFKKFRYNKDKERNLIADQIQSSKEQIKSMAEHLPTFKETDSLIDFITEGIDQSYLDAADLIPIHSMPLWNIDKIITDDRDFVSMSNIKVYTANKNIIQEAKEAGAFISR